VIRVGHKGADLLAPGNTPASFDAALAAGVDKIEFDVLAETPEGHGELYLSHDFEELRHGRAPTLAAGLEHLAKPAFDGIEFIVDVKLPGYEDAVLAALEHAGLTGRCLLSSPHAATLSHIRRHAPAVRIGWSVPRVRRDYTTDLLTKIPALAIACGYRAWLAPAARRALTSRRVDAVMAHWRLVDARLKRAVVDEGRGELYVWTVDDRARIARLRALGVSAVISNDPRLFASA
jgi:glycerophosphoryl diester phosphodiesterase